MKFYRYRVTVRHDLGTAHLTTVATSAKAARGLIMKAERCPRRAILSTKNVGRVA